MIDTPKHTLPVEAAIRTAALFGAAGCTVLSGMAEIGRRMELVTKFLVDGEPERPESDCYQGWAQQLWARATRGRHNG